MRRDGTLERHAVVTTLPLRTGDVIRIRTGNGGGFGPPAERARERVLEDLRDGLVSSEVAAAVYGVEA